MTLRHRGIHRLGYVHLAVANFDDSLRFAQEQLGLLVYRREGRRAYLRCWHEPHAFSYVLEEGAAQLIEIGFEVRDDSDLDALAERVSAAGVAVVPAPKDTPLSELGRSVSFAVPAGPTLRLFASQTTPGCVVGAEAPDWNVPRELAATCAPLYLAHVAFTSPDAQRAIDFLATILAFGISERIVGADGRVLSALLFRTSSGQDLAVFPGPGTRLHHVAFAREDEIDILRDGALLRQAGVQIDLYGPTRQSYGKTFSLHFFEPGGARLELCSGGRLCELHPDFRAVTWRESNLGTALAFYDDVINDSFLQASL